jgi:hypothetical protein
MNIVAERFDFELIPSLHKRLGFFGNGVRHRESNSVYSAVWADIFDKWNVLGHAVDLPMTAIHALRESVQAAI